MLSTIQTLALFYKMRPKNIFTLYSNNAHGTNYNCTKTECVLCLPEFMQCLLRLYRCQESGERRCPNVELCQKPVEPVVTETEENLSPVSTSSSRPTTSTSSSVSASSSSRPINQRPVVAPGASDSKLKCLLLFGNQKT
jgi:hypothetical protein